MVLAALGMPDDDVGASQALQHARGDVPGERATGDGRNVLRADLNPHPLCLQQNLHAADAGVGRHDGYLGAGIVVIPGVMQQPGQPLYETGRFNVVEVHLPVSGDQRSPSAHTHPLDAVIPGQTGLAAACLPGIRGTRRRPWKYGRTRCRRSQDCVRPMPNLHRR